MVTRLGHQRNLSLAIVAFIVVTCGVPQVPISAAPMPGVVLDQRVEPYPVAGTSLLDLARALSMNAPRGSDSRRHDALTRWGVRWRYTGSRAVVGGCAPTGVSVLLDITVVVPTWPDSANTAIADSVRQEWMRYLTALKSHEGTHAGIAIRGANRLAADLGRLRSAACYGLSGDMTRITQEAVTRLRQESEEYDRKTQHGLSEGARLRFQPAGSPSPPNM